MSFSINHCDLRETAIRAHELAQVQHLLMTTLDSLATTKEFLAYNEPIPLIDKENTFLLFLDCTPWIIKTTRFDGFYFDDDSDRPTTPKSAWTNAEWRLILRNREAINKQIAFCESELFG